MVANHLSFLDILVLFRLRRHFRAASKVEMFKIPRLAGTCGSIAAAPLKRGDKQSVREMMQSSRKRPAEWQQLMIFPEERPRDGKLQKFKTGAFQLALETKSPILPIVRRHVEDAAQARLRAARTPRDRHPRPARDSLRDPALSVDDDDRYACASSRPRDRHGRPRGCRAARPETRATGS